MIPYLVMEFVDAMTLAQAMQQQTRWPFRRAAHVAREIALALEAIHAGVIYQGETVAFVHRDLKPANIFLIKKIDGSETIKVADFGLVKMQGAMQTLSESRSGRFIGTARYASPEQCRGEETLDRRSDLYSLGCILYELLAGQNPFGLPSQSSPTQYLMAHVQKSVVPFRSQLGVPDSLTQIVDRCLHKDPGQRYSSATELQEALTTFLTTTS
ncbi:MAG: serine/threonine protein kinase [Synechococcaceae cyanobacterium SM2_3_1]|nr:serine/threonine protein kinase [Synechococcaceae cyanobacterium SM2_3_1]